MNWVLIVVMLLLIWEMMRGYRRGLLRTIYSLVSWVIVLVIVTLATPHIDAYLIEHTTLYDKIEAYCETSVRENAQNKIEQQVTDGSGEDPIAELGIKLPEGVWNDVLEKTGNVADEFLETSGVYNEVAKGVAGFIVEGISFFIALVIARIIVHLISRFLGVVSRIPVIRGINKTLGIFAGAIYGLILVWIAFYLVALGSTSELGGMIISYIYQNPLLTFLYENNFVITIIMQYL